MFGKYFYFLVLALVSAGFAHALGAASAGGMILAGIAATSMIHFRYFGNSHISTPGEKIYSIVVSVGLLGALIASIKGSSLGTEIVAAVSGAIFAVLMVSIFAKLFVPTKP